MTEKKSAYRLNTLGLEIYGESHSERIGVKITGLPENLEIDEEELAAFMGRRAPGKNAWSTPRKEADLVNFDRETEGVLEGYIVNTNTKPKDYSSILNCPRPSHADYTGRLKYGADAALSGGGSFSGRMTAPLCIAGGIALQQLKRLGIEIHSHVKEIAGIKDVSYFDSLPDSEENEKFLIDLKTVEAKEFPVISDEAGERMKASIEEARMDRDSVGGVIETVITGIIPGLGGPLFDGLEVGIASMIFTIPAVKGLEFGIGFEAARLRASENNDSLFYRDDGSIGMRTNRSGGILGGISVGGETAPVVFDCAIKATPSISKKQQTIDIANKTNTEIEIPGRHDPCIVPRAVPVTEAAAALAIWDVILSAGKGEN